MFQGKKIFILGMARSGYEAAKLLINRNNEIIINDNNQNQDKRKCAELKKLGVKVILGEHPLELFDQSFDYLIKNPGIKNDHIYVKKALSYNIPVLNEVEMAFHLFPKDVDIIGITGTNGKTTTTTIIYLILKKAFKRVHLLGNIGIPVSSFVKRLKPKDIIVMEVSIQQLCNFQNFKTTMSIFTNLFPAHLDFVDNYENYQQIKKRIFNHHTNKNLAILNYDNNDLLKLTNDIPSSKKYFSSKKENVKGCYLKEEAIYYNEEKIISLKEIKLKGVHNYENIMAAIIVAKEYDVSNEIIKSVLKEFKGVEHRIEFVRKLKGVEFYNDSKSTNIKATQIALSSFNKPIILLLGGLDRGHSFLELNKYLKNVKLIISFGETKERIKEWAHKLNKDCLVLDNLKGVIEEVEKNMVNGDLVLLSPACASWDQYADFEERGREFKELVNKLKGD